MKKETLNELYGRIYDFTDVAGDSALELMDNFIESEDLTEVMDRFLNEAELSKAEITRLAQCFEEVIDECEFEFGEDDEYEDDDE
jgi:hypothetical protein